MTMATKYPWKRGLPPGKYYPGMVDDFEISFAVIGGVWHRRRTADQIEEYRRLLAANRAALKARAAMGAPDTAREERNSDG